MFDVFQTTQNLVKFALLFSRGQPKLHKIYNALAKQLTVPVLFGQVLAFIGTIAVGSTFLCNFLTYSVCLLFATNNTKQLSTVKVFLY